MLGITRKRGESITLIVDGTTFEIKVTRTGQHRVNLAIDAPQNVVAVRTELIERKQTGQDAAGSDAGLTQER